MIVNRRQDRHHVSCLGTLGRKAIEKRRTGPCPGWPIPTDTDNADPSRHWQGQTEIRWMT
jgi:hypothetical protein